MKALLLVIVLFWVATGPAILRLEIMRGNKKLFEIKGFARNIDIFAKSMFYGPYTRSKVIGKL